MGEEKEEKCEKRALRAAWRGAGEALRTGDHRWPFTAVTLEAGCSKHVEGIHEGSEGFQLSVCVQMGGRKYEPSARMLAEPSESLWGKGSALSLLIHAHVYVFTPFLTKECLSALSQTGANPTAQCCYPRTGACWQKSS